MTSSFSVVGANSFKSSKRLASSWGKRKPSVTISKDTIFVSEAAEDCWRLWHERDASSGVSVFFLGASWQYLTQAPPTQAQDELFARAEGAVAF